MILVQTILISWTKASRGGRLAELRSRVPKRLPVRIADDSAPVVWHAVTYSERNDFVEPFSANTTIHISNNRFGCRNVEVEIREDSAILTYRYQTGVPARRFFDKSGNYVPPEHSIVVTENRWSSIEYNGRFSCIDTGNWWYEHVIVNVAVGTSIEANIFATSDPIEQYCQLTKLR
jgi:hypothetical protein